MTSYQKLTPIAALVIVAAAALFGLSSSLALLHANWTAWYGPAEHGYLVLAASLWLAITNWRADPPRSLKPDWWAVLPLLTLVTLLAGLELLFVNNSRLLLLPPLALAVVALVFGREALRRLFVPALFLYFALPQWWAINGLLQSTTITAVTHALRWTRVPAFVDESFVQLPSGTFEIASGCSGLNYLQAATALAAFHGLLSLSTWRNRFLLVAVAAGVAVAFNWVRVYAVVLVGYFSEMQHYLVTNEHHTFGWVLFMTSMVPVYLFAMRLERGERRSVGAAATSVSYHASPSRLLVPAAVAAAAMLLLPTALQPAAASDVAASTALPATLGERPRTPIASGWSPVFANAKEDSATFGNPPDAVEVYRAVYPQQTGEQRLLRPDNDFLGPGFRLLEQRRRDVLLENGAALKLMEFRGTLRNRPRVVLAWYWIGGAPIAGALEAKIAELRALLAGRRDAVALALAADCVPDCDATQEALVAFASRHQRELQWPEPQP
jgi:EpsI family protein